MQQKNLTIGDPLVLSLTADARVCHPDYLNDQIWDLNIGDGEPTAISVDTTFGLRARSMRIFPVFRYNDRMIIDPIEFTSGIFVDKNYPNFISLSFFPIKDLDVRIEYWVPDSHQIAGRMKLINTSEEDINIQVDWAALLVPSSDGERMSPVEIGSATVLAGRTEDLRPIFFLTGGPEGSSGPYPCLSRSFLLGPGSSHHLIWVFSVLHEHEDSFEQARETASANWNGICAHMDMVNSGTLGISTGDPDWDATYQQAQKVAYSLIMDNTEALPNPSYVSERSPDQGFSKRGDGSDYDHLWNGQTPLETYFFIDYLLPSNVNLAKGLLDNFIYTQNADGFIDWKPGLNGFRSQLLSMPILASIAMKIYRYSEDKDYLKAIFPRLILFFESWFSLSHDKDQDGIPEWEHVLQTGFEDNPLFTYWHEGSHGVSIYKVEGPDICSFLYRECNSLLEIANIISNNEAEDSIRKKAKALRAAVENSWNEQINSYQYWDRDTHSCNPVLSLGMRTGPGDILINKNFDDALRINVFIKANGEIPSNLQLFIHGTTHTGTHRIERISPEQLHWHLRNGYATSDRAFESLDHIHIQGVSDADIIEIKSLALDHQNQSLLLPLWAGIPSQKRAKLLIKKTLTDQNRYWQEFGVRACAHPNPQEGEASSCESINILWNSLLVEGLIHYGYRSLAAELIERNMTAIIRSLKEDRAFRRVYSAESGEGRGEKNIITSLAPLGAFLSTLGIHILAQRKVELNAFNPFPWPVTLKYRGLTIIRQKKNSTLIFPDGKTLTLKNGKQQLVSQE